MRRNNKRVECLTCGGYGWYYDEGMIQKKCETCNGEKTIPIKDYEIICPCCNGKRYIERKPGWCGTCKGEGKLDWIDIIKMKL